MNSELSAICHELFVPSPYMLSKLWLCPSPPLVDSFFSSGSSVIFTLVVRLQKDREGAARCPSCSQNRGGDGD